MTDRFLSELIYVDAPIRSYYDLTAPLGFHSKRAGLEIWAPAGFRTNFVTGRKLLIVRRIVQDKMNRAAVIHDVLYSQGTLSREMSDSVFRDAMLADGVRSWRAWAAWSAVRVCGWKFYKGVSAVTVPPEPEH